MKKTYHKISQGAPFNYVHWDACSDINVFFLHGSGELGAPDGSQLSKVEIAGYPWFANRMDLPFNLYAPQITTESTGKAKMRDALPRFTEGMKNRVGTGWSYGAQFVLTFLLQGMTGYDPNTFDTFVSFAGRGSGTPDYLGLTKPLCLVAGTADKAISYNSSKVIYNNINSDLTRKSELLFITIQNGTHVDAVRKGCNPDALEGAQVIDFIKRNSI